MADLCFIRDGKCSLVNNINLPRYFRVKSMFKFFALDLR